MMILKMWCNTNTKRLLSGIMSVMLAFTCIVSIPQTAVIVHADEEKTITGLGTGAIANPVNGDTEGLTGWTGNYIYYGKHNGKSVKYRVLSTATTDFGGVTMLLDCNRILIKKKHDTVSPFEYGVNGWDNSEIKAWLNGSGEQDFYQYSFTAPEKEAIAASWKSTKSSSDGVTRECYTFQPLTGEKIFLLDTTEVVNSTYGFSSDIQTTVTRKKPGASTWWWLRSPDNTLYEDCASSYPEGVIYSHEVNAKNGAVSPAFNIDLSAVIFSSALAGEEGCFKLTIADKDLNITPGTVTKNGATVTVPYTITGLHSANASRVSVLILEKEYSAGCAMTSGYTYMKLNVDAFGTSGTGTFNLPDSYADKSYYVYILAEDENGSKKTDYASSPVLILHNVGNDSSGSKYEDLHSALDEAINQGGPQTVIWNKGNALTYGDMKMLQYNPEVTLIFNYSYKDVDYSVTIPGRDAKADDNIPWYGPMYLYANY